jgi:hypothetical protein
LPEGAFHHRRGRGDAAVARSANPHRHRGQWNSDVERRIDGARKVGAHKTSMLQDLERGRPMEIDPLVSVVREMGRLTRIPTPALWNGPAGRGKIPRFCMIALP